MTLEFIVRGQVVKAEEIKPPKPAPKPKSEGPAEFHKGFQVVAYRPGQVEEAERLHIQEKARWDALSSEEQAKRLRSGERDPGPWSFDTWSRKTKPKRVSRMFAAPGAAEEFKEIAEKEGFTSVTVQAVERRKT